MTDTDDIFIAPDSDIYHAVVNWGRRRETPEALASRWIALIERLRALDPLFAYWWHWDEERGCVPFDPRLEAQVARVIAGTQRHVTGRLLPEGGSVLLNETKSLPRSRNIGFKMYAGGDNPYEDNSVNFGTSYFAVPDPDVASYRIFRGALLATAEIFEATQGHAYPTDLLDLWPKDSTTFKHLPLAWISYVAPRFAHLVTPPPGAIVENRPDGGLLMAATDETFVTANPTHLATARAIHAALEPFNAVPWTAETGK